MTDNRLIIFDTTLRDGEQSPGASMNLAEKLEIAHAPCRARRGRDRGRLSDRFARRFRGGAGDRPAGAGPIICGLARCNDADIDRAWEALREAPKPRIHVFLATSAIHREFKLRMAKEEIVRRAVEGVERAQGYLDDVEFSPEDAARTELDFLAEVVEKVVEAGATTHQHSRHRRLRRARAIRRGIRYLKQNVRGIDKVVLSVHCHNDLGLAVANSLAALKEGARQVECTINGLGERAGNCALEEIVMAVRTAQRLLQASNAASTPSACYPTSRLVSRVTGMHVQRNKAIVGQNAFAHEAGIHQDGMLKDASTYEIMRPEDVGVLRTELVLGKHSGRHALSQRIRDLGYHLDNEQLQKVFEDFKVLADRKKTIYDADIEALAEAVLQHRAGGLDARSRHLQRRLRRPSRAPPSSCGTRTARIHRDACTGDGPIDAVFKTIERITSVDVKLRQFSITSVTEDEDAQGEAQVEAEFNGRILRGRAVSTDIIEASAAGVLAGDQSGPLREQLKMNPQTEAVSVT